MLLLLATALTLRSAPVAADTAHAAALSQTPVILSEGKDLLLPRVTCAPEDSLFLPVARKANHPVAPPIARDTVAPLTSLVAFADTAARAIVLSTDSVSDSLRRVSAHEALSVPATTADTVPVRRRRKVVAVEYSDWYGRRLTVHRWASYLTLPLFAGNYATGQQLLDKGNQAPEWAIRYHGPLATTVATLFGVNTVTGVWNLIDGRNDPNGRKWRTTHAVLMLVADAGFTTAGILSNEAERSDSRRRLHRTVALSSIGVSLVSYAMMLKPFRHD